MSVSMRRAQRLLETAAKMRLRLISLGGLWLVLIASHALAGPRRCGDDVKGKTVPCDCGDILVSSRTLGPDDPIATRPCEDRGLIVDVPPDRPAATLALGGQVLRGTGHGNGIQVLSGGNGGLTILGPGTVEQFATGIQSPGGALARVSGVTAASNRADGFSIGGEGFEVRDSEAARNGRDGFSLRGSGYQVNGNRAVENARHGFTLAGRDALVGTSAANEASANGRMGFALRGRDHDLKDPVAIGNAQDGVRARVARGRIAGAYASGNGRYDVRAAGGDLTVDTEGASESASTPPGLSRHRRCRNGACR